MPKLPHLAREKSLVRLVVFESNRATFERFFFGGEGNGLGKRGKG